MGKNTAERAALHRAKMTEAAVACFRDKGVTMEIPYAFLWGRQPIDEYNDDDLKDVRHALQNQGRALLEQHPISAAFVTPPHSLLSYIVIYDGHHRARMAPKIKVFDIPARVVLIDELAQSLDVKPEGLVGRFNRETSIAFADFKDRNPALPKPRYVDCHVRTARDLAEYFQNRAYTVTPNPRTVLFQAELAMPQQLTQS